MAVGTKKLRKRRQVCIGQLNQQILLQDRDIESPVAGSVDYGEVFSGDTTVWALVETVTGKTLFDSTNIERIITHHFYIRYITGISSETWVTYKGQKFDIYDTEELDEREEFLLLSCSVRGSNEKLVNFS